VKRRSGEITKIFDSYTTTEHLLNSTQLVLVTSYEEKQKDQVIGHTKNYTKVVIKAATEEEREQLLGKMILVRILST